MGIRKTILATVGVAMCVCAANAQSWTSNSYGLYNTPLTGNTGNVTIGATPSNSTKNYKLYVNGLTRFVTENGSKFDISGPINSATTGVTLASQGSTYYARMNFYAADYVFRGNAGAIFMTVHNSQMTITRPLVVEGNTELQRNLNVLGKITCHDELEVAEVKADQIKTKDINVEMNNAADYVFDENYNLRSLNEVESFVKENKHLPGVPSAAEMAENGMSMSQMSNLLLEKVEELTLHLIDMKKEINSLKEENASLRSKLECK